VHEAHRQHRGQDSPKLSLNVTKRLFRGLEQPVSIHSQH